MACYIKLESVTKDEGHRVGILSQLLRQKHPAAVERYLEELGDEDGFTYRTFRDHPSQEIVAALRPRISQLTGGARERAQMLLVLSEKDPVPAVVALLDDPQWKDKGLVMSELARLGDARAVAPVARILREAPRGYLNVEPLVFSGVLSALRAIADAGTAESVRELIELLPVDLARFTEPDERADFPRIVAAHLIELTGESFGVDADAWRAWHRAQPAEK